MKNRGIIKAVLVAATIALSSITVLAVENNEQMGIVTEVNQNNEVEAAEDEPIIEEVKPEEIKPEESKLEEVKPEESKLEEKEEIKKSKGEEVIEYAKKFIGTPYVYAGNSLTKGVDCSGFTSQVYKNFDISLQRRSADQFASNGTKVKKADLQVGDLVFYGYSSVTHVGIYMGDNQIIHASTSHGVKIDSLDLRGMPPIMGYRRVI